MKGVRMEEYSHYPWTLEHSSVGWEWKDKRKSWCLIAIQSGGRYWCFPPQKRQPSPKGR